MNFTVFYSWQSDLPNSTNRGFIGKALENAAKSIGSDKSLRVEPVIDRDTLGISGSPDIASTIFDKIEQAQVFVCDVSIINPESGFKPTPNPNVLIELGYALKTLGTERIIMILNTAFGDVNLLPFDLRMKRVITYHMPETSPDRSTERKALERKFESALVPMIQQHKEQEEIPLEVFIWYESKLDRMAMTLHYDWSWELIFNLVVYYFANNPNKELAKKFPPDLSSYKIVDLNTEKWISPPDIAGKLRTDRIALVHISDVEKLFPELEEILKGKAFAKSIKQFISGRK